MKYKHLFFDLDHTLWDFDANAKESLKELFESFELDKKGIPDFETFHNSYFIHNEKLWARLRKGFISRKDLRWKRMWHTLLDFKIGDVELSNALGEKYLEILPLKKKLFPGTIETLDYLKDKGYPLHLITNGFEKTQLLKLSHSGIEGYFDNMITSEIAGSLKPKREIFDCALKKAGCSASEGLMVGDALEIDILGAQKVGMDQVYFNPGKPAYNGIEPTYTIMEIPELQSIL